MTTALQAFQFKGAAVRTAGTFEAPLFCAADVCEILTLGNVSKACERLDQDEVVMAHHAAAENKPKALSSRGEKRSLYVTESGLYSLIIGCGKPEAKAFKKWVTSEVLPAIRKYGYYSLIEADTQKQTELLLAECFPKLPTKAAPIFRELIHALLVVRREQGASGNPPWARSLAHDIYGWAFKKVGGQQPFRRGKNPKHNGSHVDHSMLSVPAQEAVNHVAQAGAQFAQISVSWADWKSKMQVVFGGHSFQPDLFPGASLMLVGKK